MMNFS
jgi:hypothetical protein